VLSFLPRPFDGLATLASSSSVNAPGNPTPPGIRNEDAGVRYTSGCEGVANSDRGVKNSVRIDTSGNPESETSPTGDITGAVAFVGLDTGLGRALPPELNMTLERDLRTRRGFVLGRVARPRFPSPRFVDPGAEGALDELTEPGVAAALDDPGAGVTYPLRDDGRLGVTCPFRDEGRLT
jgi:hypothetical protein